jgi:hypothetical protein
MAVRGSRRNLSELIRVLKRGMVGMVLDMVVEFERCMKGPFIFSNQIGAEHLYLDK